MDEIDNGVLGCDLDDLPVILSGHIGPATPGCPHWRTLWPMEIQQYHPAVVGLLIGRWELSDHYFDGQWMHVGETVWDDHLLSELRQVIQILSAGGVKVVLFTMPFVDPPQKAPNGAPYPENTSERVSAYNSLDNEVAMGNPRVEVIDLNAILDPAGHFQAVVDGIVVRWSDGVHISEAGGQWLQPRILPEIAQLGFESGVRPK